jgi:hypothetical protein
VGRRSDAPPFFVGKEKISKNSLIPLDFPEFHIYIPISRNKEVKFQGIGQPGGGQDCAGNTEGRVPHLAGIRAGVGNKPSRNARGIGRCADAGDV